MTTAIGRQESQKYEEIRAFIEERSVTDKRDKERLKNVSKKIKQCIRDNKRTKKQEKIPQISQEFKGIKSIANINSAKKNVLTPKICDEKDEIATSRKGICKHLRIILQPISTPKGNTMKTKELTRRKQLIVTKSCT